MASKKKIIKKVIKKVIKKKHKPVHSIKPKKKKVLDDDEDEVEVEVKETIVESPIDSEDSDDTVSEPIEDISHDTISDTAEMPLIGDDDGEVFNLSKSGEGDEGQLEVIRYNNPKPKLSWAEIKNPKFSVGELVILKSVSKDDELNEDPYKIICASKDVETYSVKKSKFMNETILKGKDLKRAPKNGKPYVSFWDAQNPLLNINKKK